MKIICKKSDLQKSISIVSKAVSSKTTMPILETILINASAAEIHFTANDMELGIDTIVTLLLLLIQTTVHRSPVKKQNFRSWARAEKIFHTCLM